MKSYIMHSLLIVLAVLPFPRTALALGGELGLTLRLTRDFGYGGLNKDIEGLFSLHAEGPDDLHRVDFYIDDILVASDTEPPFRTQFSTGEYSPGQHRMHAIGFTSSRMQFGSNEIVREFLTDEEAWDRASDLVFPLLGIVLAIGLFTALAPVLFLRQKPQAGKYGISGGAVCPKCGLPFACSFFSMHLGASNLQRCPHCGKWSWVRRASADDLRDAEVRWQSEGSEVKGESEVKRQKRQIDDSRYDISR